MRWNTFFRSALFAACGAAAYLPAVAVLGPTVDVQTATALYLAALVTCYIAGLVRPGLHRLRAALIVGGLGVALVAGAASLREVVLGLAAVLAVARSACLYKAPPARALLTELALVGGGLCFARFLLAQSVLSGVLAIWGFFLVQAIFFLVRGITPRVDPQRDPFEAAHRRAMAVLAEHRP